MTALEERMRVVADIGEACDSGARLPEACETAGIALRTYRRWRRDGVVQADRRPEAERRAPGYCMPPGSSITGAVHGRR